MSNPPKTLPRANSVLSKDEIKRRTKEEKNKKKFLKSITGHSKLTLGRTKSLRTLKNTSLEELQWLLEAITQFFVNFKQEGKKNNCAEGSGSPDDKLEKEKEYDPFNGNEDMWMQAVTSVINIAYPVEKILGARVLILKPQNKMLDVFVRLAADGQITFHNEIKLEDLEIEERIAQGASAQVFRAKWNNRVVALKMFDPEHISFSETEFRREVALLNLLANDNLVPCYGACTNASGGSYYIVCELMGQGSLWTVLRELQEFIDLKMMIKWCRDISRGMKWIHSVNIIHRDLKSLNLLINTDLTLKIIDFGLSRVVADEEKLMTANTGTPAWIAPEILMGERYSEKADIYSMGIVMWEILTGEEPYKGMEPYRIPDYVTEEGQRPPIPTKLSGDRVVGAEYQPYIDIMKRCWDARPENRPSFQDLEQSFVEMLSMLERNEKG